MKTSFFFCLWMLIYPLLGLLGNEFVDQYSFFFALLVIYFLSRFIASKMPNIIGYEQACELARVMEPAYLGDVKKFRKIVGARALMDTIWAVYMLATVVSLVFIVMRGYTAELFTLVIFGLFGYAAVRSSVKFLNGYFALVKNPTPEQCVECVDTIYGMDYASYYEAHMGQTLAQMLPPRPKHYSTYLAVSIFVACVCALLGGIILISSIVESLVYSGSLIHLFLGINFLYSSVAVYFGVKDLFSSISAIKATK